jgi:hypothetical protein
MPDDWEVLFGLDPADPRDAANDADGDGEDNLQEFRAGTDPHDSGSVLDIGLVQFVNGVFEIQVQSTLGKHYSLERTETLAPDQWMPVVRALPGTGGTLSLRDGSPAKPGGRFYRVRVLVP